MGSVLIIIGVITTAAGIILLLVERAGFPHLPGDIFIQKENFTFYVPIVTMLLVSVVLTIIMNLFRGK